MTGFRFISILAVIAVAVSLILAVFLLTVKTKHRLSNILLAAFILINGTDLSMLFTGRWLQHYPGLLVFVMTIGLLTNPFLYLYALSICNSDFRLKPKHLLHTIPFIVLNSELVPRYYLTGFAAQLHMLGSYTTILELGVMIIVGHLQFIFYITGIFLTLKKYRKVYLENYADPAIITYRWMFQLTVIDTIVHGVVLLKVLKFSSSGILSNELQLLVGINAVFILCWFVFKALYNPDLFRGVSFRLEPLTEKAAPIVDSQTRQKIVRLQQYMQANEPYLDASLSIQQLARQVKMPVKELSILINLHLGQHFSILSMPTVSARPCNCSKLIRKNSAPCQFQRYTHVIGFGVSLRLLRIMHSLVISFQILRDDRWQGVLVIDIHIND